ncbi:hypothetical protein NMY22_g2583 [Coprinellus aureogranulatus]|nr:hypothetical protein NMY22_g2583 [Coprinellus aureogranulatus]
MDDNESTSMGSGSMTTTEAAKCPVPECDIPVDIVLRSSDKALIGAHQTNLAQFSEGFPSPSDVNSSSEPVDLTEDGGTLNLLMQFMHKQRHPNLSMQETSISTTLKLAEAAEKYLVYAAMNACYIRIDDPRALRDNSLEALKYAVKFDYPDLADRAALWTLPAYGITSITKSFGKGISSRDARRYAPGARTTGQVTAPNIS